MLIVILSKKWTYEQLNQPKDVGIFVFLLINFIFVRFYRDRITAVVDPLLSSK